MGKRVVLSILTLSAIFLIFLIYLVATSESEQIAFSPKPPFVDGLDGLESITGNAIVSNPEYSHIQTWMFLTGTSSEIDPSEGQWIGEHFDLAFGSVGDPSIIRQANSDILFCSGRPLEYLWNPRDSQLIEDWGLTNNKDYENAFLHARVDFYESGYGNIKGWNPADDQGQCGGTPNDWINDLIANIDGTCTGQPSDPQRTSPTGEEARIQNGLPNVNSQEWLDWATQDSIDCGGYYENCNPECIWEDNAIYLPFGQFYYNKTLEYWNQEEDYSHPNIEDRIVAGKNLASQVDSQTNKNTFALPNVGATSPLYDEARPYLTLMNQNINNVMIEIWMDSIDGDPNYNSNHDSDILGVLQDSKSGKFRFLQTPEYKENTNNRNKLLFLSSYYLISNENTFYSYKIYPSASYPDSVRKKEHPENYVWFDAIEYNIGQPTTNSYGKTDYNGNANTNEHFIFAQGQDPSKTSDTYYVLGREFENALVLSKLKPSSSSSTGDNSATTHSLNRYYKKLNSDGSMSSELNSISIRNNEAFILVKSDPPGSGGGNTGGEDTGGDTGGDTEGSTEDSSSTEDSTTENTQTEGTTNEGDITEENILDERYPKSNKNIILIVLISLLAINILAIFYVIQKDIYS